MGVLNKNKWHDYIDDSSFGRIAEQAAYIINKTHKIEKLQLSENKNCAHKNTSYCGVFVGTWCFDCNTRVD